MSLKHAANYLATHGRGGDSMLVHMTPGEVGSLQALAMAHGGSLSVNPSTGLPEASFLSNLLPTIAGAALTPFIGPLGAALAVGAAGTIANKGDLGKGIMAGLGAYGGANLTSALIGAGEGAATAGMTSAAAREAAQNAATTSATPFASALKGAEGVMSAEGRNALLRNAGGGKELFKSGLQAFLPATMGSATDGVGLPADTTANPRYRFIPGQASVLNAPRRTGVQQNYFPGMRYETYADGGATSSLLSGYEYDPLTQRYNPVEPSNKPAATSGSGGLGQEGAPPSPGTPSPGTSSLPSGMSPGFNVPSLVDTLGPIGAMVPGGTIGDTLSNLAGFGNQSLAAIQSGAGVMSLMTPEGRAAAASIVDNSPLANEAAPSSLGPATGYDMDVATQSIADAAVSAPSDPGVSVSEAGSPADSTAADNSGIGGWRHGGNVKSAPYGISHLGDYSDGGRLLRGPGDGVSDSIPATIGDKQPARLADGEFVIPARIVSEIGNGSTEAGARKLYAMMDRIQNARAKTVGKGRIAKDTKSDKYLPA